MISSDPKDYYYFVRSTDEIYLYPIQEWEYDTGYDDSLVELHLILSQNDIHEASEQLYYTHPKLSIEDTISTLKRLGFVQNDEFDKAMDY